MAITIDSLRFDPAMVRGWVQVDDNPRGQGWIDDPAAPQIVLSKDLYPDSRADYGVDLADVDALRKILRASSNEQGHGLVSADVLTIRGVAVVRLIEKAPQQPSGMAYLGTLTVIGPAAFFMLRVNCFEVSLTGYREAVVLDQCLKAGSVIADTATGRLLGWSRDPYDGGQEYPLMPNVAEEHRFDLRFPDHPLSRCRSMLSRIESSMQFDEVFCSGFLGR